MRTESEEVEFWDSRYRTGRTPWDFGGVPAALRRWLAATAPQGRALIPGCGSGYEVQAFHEAGWDVTAIDYAPAAVERARAMLGDLGNKVLLGDFFTHDFGPEKFDVAYERTFLCALPPELWPAYQRRMAQLLVGRGKLAGTFFYGRNDDPPPYPLTREAADAILGAGFVRAIDEGVADSLPMFAGQERWQVWEKREWS